MTPIDAQLTREFFELNGFRVHTCWAQSQRGDAVVQIYADNPSPIDGDTADLVLAAEAVRSLARIHVEVRPWHAERMYVSVIENNPILTHFARPESAEHARQFFEGESFSTVLVASEFPSNPEARARAISMLEASPVDHVLEFPTMLRYLINAVNVNGAYNASATLQLLQLLKRYRLIEHQQMEFLFPMEAPAPAQRSEVETAPASTEEGDKYEEDEWE